MRRRDFVTLLYGAASAWPSVSRAQPIGDKVRRIGVLNVLSETDQEGQARLAAFVAKLRELGWRNGENLIIDVRWNTAAETERLRSVAKDLVALQPDVVVAGATHAVTALARETSSVPIVFVSVSDPVGNGLVTDISRPGGNITGFTSFEFSIGGKWLETIKEIAPTIMHADVMFNPATATYARNFMPPIEAAGTSLGVDVSALPVRDTAELDRAFGAVANKQNAALIVIADIFAASNRDRIIKLAGEHRLPAVYPYRFYATAGGLVSYGPESLDLYRRAAAYADRILRGAKPGDLPIQQPIKYELIINRNTAQALGLSISSMLLARADEVIE
jgi:putative tryptophan/tyrosine transport system substrate-binding protein